MQPNQDQDTMQGSLLAEQLQRLPTGEVEQFWQTLMEEYGGFFPAWNTPSLFELLMPGEGGLDLATLLHGILRFFWSELMYNGELLGSIIVLTVFAMVLQSIQNAFEQQTVSKVAYAVTYLVMLILVFNSFRLAMDYAQEAITNMVDFMLALIPLLLGMMASLGNLVSATVFHPMMIFTIYLIGNLVRMVILPLIFFAAILNMVSHFSDQYRVTRLAGLMNKLTLGVLGIVITLFLTVISLQGMTAAAADGMTMRTAKYIAGNFVPVVGRMFADAADTVVGASLMVKNVIGLSGVIIVIFLSFFPAVKILALGIIYSLAGAVLQPLGDSPMIQCLSTVGKSLMLIFAAVAIVGLMFFMAITVIIAAGNVSFMMR